jgi:hypothetical protein
VVSPAICARDLRPRFAPAICARDLRPRFAPAICAREATYGRPAPLPVCRVIDASARRLALPNVRRVAFLAVCGNVSVLRSCPSKRAVDDAFIVSWCRRWVRVSDPWLRREKTGRCPIGSWRGWRVEGRLRGRTRTRRRNASERHRGSQDPKSSHARALPRSAPARTPEFRRASPRHGTRVPRVLRGGSAGRGPGDRRERATLARGRARIEGHDLGYG